MAESDGAALAPEAPAPTRRRSDRHQGTLVLIGGAIEPDGAAFAAFLEHSRAREGGKIVGLTSASGDPARAARDYRETFRSVGIDNVEIPVIDRRDRAQDAAIAELIRSASGIFLGGGDQVQLVATLGGSRVGRAMLDAYVGGATIGGTSAGAAALTETIFAGAEPDEYGQMQDLHLGPGFGFLGFRAIIDTHFTQRRRLQRLFMVIARNPELRGLGSEEDTALVVRGHLGEVVGRGSVTFVDGRGTRFSNTEDVMRGQALTLSYLRVGIVGAGHALDLRERELEVLVRARADAEPMQVVRGDGAAV
jgi:cyanophycinase